MTSRTLTLGGSTYPVILPNIRDPRLNVAAVIITIHVLGQVGLRFQVSVPQILAVDPDLRDPRSGADVPQEPVVRVAGQRDADRQRRRAHPPRSRTRRSATPGPPTSGTCSPASPRFSLLTKYVIRYRGTHVFNPSNIGLVVVFVVLGSTRVEPLDFWWAPLNGWMITAYAVILVGGVLITRRLRLLAAAVTFWIALAVGVGILAASGHCMTARWAFAPVCGFDYWRVIVTSPEVLIFLFFMITDPKTVPAGRVGRVVFGLLVAVASTLLMAPQTDEFGTKVALLGGLVVVCAGRPARRPARPRTRSAADDLGRFATRLATGGHADAGILPDGAFGSG